MNNEKLLQIKENIQKVIIGKSGVIDLVLTALLAGGHVLLDDVPGTGKTVLAKSLARSVDASYSRIQFTPDLLPSDVTGMNYYNQKESAFVLRKGPAFCNILLADEIISALDVPIQNQILTLLLQIKEEYRLSVLFITHDLSVARAVSDRVMVMREGRIRGIGSPEEVFSDTADPYIKELASSVFTFRGVG